MTHRIDRITKRLDAIQDWVSKAEYAALTAALGCIPAGVVAHFQGNRTDIYIIGGFVAAGILGATTYFDENYLADKQRKHDLCVKHAADVTGFQEGLRLLRQQEYLVEASMAYRQV